MIGIVRVCEIGQVTAGAIRRSSGKVSVDVARNAFDADVGSGEPELGRIVVEGRALPVGRGMTPAAVVREARGHVIRICRGGKCLRMTAIALGRSTLETVAGMTRCARQLGVGPRQAEMCKLRVVEFGALPLIHAVAYFARDRKIRGHMIHRTRLLEIALVATDARCAQADELSAGGSRVTRVALQRGMCTQ